MTKFIDLLIKFLALSPVLVTIVLGILNYKLNKDRLLSGNEPVKKITIREVSTQNISSDIKQINGAEIKIYFNKKEKKLQNLYAKTYEIKNSGLSPINISDFVDPLTITFPKNWEIIFALSELQYPIGIKPEFVKKSDNSLFIKPLLMNPGDLFWIKIFTTDLTNKNISFFELDSILNGIWTTRIINLKNINLTNQKIKIIKQNLSKNIDNKYAWNDFFLESLPENIKPSMKAGIYITPLSWGVYILLLISLIINVTLLYLISKTSDSIRLSNFRTILLLSFIGLFSISVSESYLYIFINKFKHIIWPNYLFVMLHFALLVYFFFSIYRSENKILSEQSH